MDPLDWFPTEVPTYAMLNILSFFNQWCWNNWIETWEKNGLWLLHYNTKNNLKWIIDLRLKVKAVRLLLGENTRGDLWFGREDFLYLKKGLKSTLTTGSASKLGWWQRLPQNLRVALFAENLKPIIQLAKFSLLFFYHHVLTILINVCDKIFLQRVTWNSPFLGFEF